MLVIEMINNAVFTLELLILSCWLKMKENPTDKTVTNYTAYITQINLIGRLLIEISRLKEADLLKYECVYRSSCLVDMTKTEKCKNS